MSTFAAFRIRPFAILWCGSLASFTAFFMSTVVQSVVAFQLTGANASVGWVIFAQGAAMLLLGPLGGALADRLPKRTVVAIGQALSAAVFAALGVMVATETISVLALALGSLAMGLTFAFVGPTRQALVIDLIPANLRGNAMALTQVANSGSRIIGPAFAGLLLGWVLFGAAGAYGVMTALYLLSALSLAWLPPTPGRADARRRRVLEDLLGGLRYLRAERRLLALVGSFVAVVMVGFSYITVLPGLVENQFGRGADEISELYVVSAVGALAASLIVARHADSAIAASLYTLMGAAFGVSLLGMAAAPSFAAVGGLMFLIGLTSGAFQSLNGAVVVRETDPAYFGRVISLTTIAFAGFGLMALPVGLLADALGERSALAGMGVAVCAVVGVLGVALARSGPAKTATETPPQASSHPR